MVAFAANSVLCRLALGTESIDAGSFTAIRLISGAIALLAIISWRNGRQSKGRRGNWCSAFTLFVYATAFSFAYRFVSAGTGALIMFGTVQLTMLLVAIVSGERPSKTEWIGVATAIAGFLVLVIPGVETPPIIGASLMTLAGVAWGVYSLRGRGSLDPLGDSTGNFLRSIPFAVIVGVAAIGALDISPRGAVLATLSGAVTSGLGYVIWYAALTNLNATRAALVQLSVPVIATLGGVLFIGETITTRFIVSAAMVLGGIGLAVGSRQTPSFPSTRDPPVR